MKVRCAAFDFDGTLVDSNAIKQDAYFAMTRRFSADESIVQAALERRPGGDRYQVSRLIAEELLARGALKESSAGTPADELARALADAYTAHCEREITACDAVAGAREALASLSEFGIALYVNTGTPTEAILPILERRDLKRYFDGVFGAPASKLANLEAIASAAGTQPAEMVLVGDGEDDRQAASSFGCAFIGIALRGESRFAGEVPLLLPDLVRLPELIQGETA